METNVMTNEQIKDLPKSAIARKHKCSVQYVRKILQGGDYKSTCAENVRKDAKDILTILER
ncbi:hypothetical protein [Dysgonomonas sp. GY617]|uniref:hypothetical protein n=1 Tax=Dysgonomonas sp. GY617 TaxID=2780420 RepID=UPI001883CC52|nr:hypothetical protein [Dysgonomonas sp. GY617]MBF0576633.1 hypothetical protein [Dysgonomonas sp. GY617]